MIFSLLLLNISFCKNIKFSFPNNSEIFTFLKTLSVDIYLTGWHEQVTLLALHFALWFFHSHTVSLSAPLWLLIDIVILTGYKVNQGYSHKCRAIRAYSEVYPKIIFIFVFHFLSFCADRPCLEDRGRVQRVQRGVELGLTHILHRDNQENLMHKVHKVSV